MVSAYARTLTHVVASTLRFCNDYRGDNTDGFLWKWSETASRANDLVLDLVRRTGILRDTKTIVLEEDVNVYDLPPDCIRPLRFMVHGLQGSLILPRTMAELDLVGQPMNVEGDPYYFMADHLTWGQIAFFPTPYRDGSTFTRDSDYGLLRQVRDADGNLPFDDNRPLRRIRGVPFVRGGDGQIIRELISPYGNVQVTYVRAPARWTDPNSYPDPDIPEFIHPFLKYGVSETILRSSKKPLHAIKLPIAKKKWNDAVLTLQRHCEYQGSTKGLEPI